VKFKTKYLLFSIALMLPFLSKGFHIRDAYMFEKVQTNNIVYVELLETKYIDEDKQINTIFDTTNNHLNTFYIFSWSKKQVRFKIKEIWKGKNNFKDSIIQFKINSNAICNSAFFSEEKKSYILFYDSIETIENRGYFYNDYTIAIQNQLQGKDLKKCILETLDLLDKKNEIPKDKAHRYIYKYLLNPNTRHWMSTEYLHRNRTTHTFTTQFTLSPEEQNTLFENIAIEDSLTEENLDIVSTFTEINPLYLRNLFIAQLKKAKGMMALEIINHLADMKPDPDVQALKRTITTKYKDYFETNSNVYTLPPESFHQDIQLFIDSILL
jgi:hypothetical protein